MKRKQKRKEKSISEKLRYLLMGYIKETPNLPEYIKPEVRRVITQYIEFMGFYLSIIELLWRRTRDVVKDEQSQTTKR